MSFRETRTSYIICLLSLAAVLAGCSTSRHLGKDQSLLNRVRIDTDDDSLDLASYEMYVTQKGNTKWFSALKIPLATYSLAGSDTTKWINRTLRNIGEKPVAYDSVQTLSTCRTLIMAMQNDGYLEADVEVEAREHRKKSVDLTYILKPGPQYHIGQIAYDIHDDSIARLLSRVYPERERLHRGMVFDVDALDAERKKITGSLTRNGYFLFHKDYISYTADSVRGQKLINLTLHLAKYRKPGSDTDTLHTKFDIGRISYSGENGGKPHLRRGTLQENTWLEEGKPYSSSDLMRTYNSFGKLQAVRYTNIQFHEVPDTSLLNCHIQIINNKPNSISIQPEGTNTSGDLGAALSLTYENRNLFRGSETFSVKLRGAYEAITGLEGYNNQNYLEYSVEGKLIFPSFVIPFLSHEFKRKSSATSELSASYNMQDRPEFHRRVFSAAWRYRWNDAKERRKYKVDVLDLNYVYMPWISQTFKTDYLENANSRNVILRYNYEDLFIMKAGFGMSYTGKTDAYKVNAETSGNLLGALSRVTRMNKDANGHYQLFNVAYAQYAKFDFDYTHIVPFDKNNRLVLHGALGVAYPYGNSTVLPFEKRYFSGGANSVRGWSVRGLGPGSFKGKDGAIDFINQTGDMKLDLNVELRSQLFWKFQGALFVDAGNIWTLREYEEQPGGQFKWDTFMKQIAVAYGAGIRLNFSYFILRFDMGMKAINPAYESRNEHYAIVHPDLGRDFSFHFAVGLPF